jgi:hypothetical protein
MFKRLQGLIAGVIIGSLLAGGAAYAAVTVRYLEAAYSDIKIVIGGQRINPTDVNGNTVEPFISNGTTYLPVRAVAQALGRTVDWDGSTQTVLISGDTSAPPTTAPAQPTPTPAPSSNVFTDSLTGPLSANWTTSGSVQSAGEKGMLLRSDNKGVLKLDDFLAEDCWNYTIEFEAIARDITESSWIFHVGLSENNADSYVRQNVDTWARIFVSDGFVNYDTYDKGSIVSANIDIDGKKYLNAKIDVTDKRFDLYLDGKYIISGDIYGSKSIIAFSTDSIGEDFYVRNFKLTVKK